MAASNQRRKYLIDFPFQAEFMLKFSAAVIGASVLIGAIIFIWAQNSTTVAIERTRIYVKPTSDFILPALSLTVVSVAVVGALVVALMALVLSHRIAGPLTRLKREVDSLKNGNLKRDFSVRDKDQLKDLAARLQAMSDALRERHLNLKENCDALAEYLKNEKSPLAGSNKEKLSKILQEIQASANYFKV